MFSIDVFLVRTEYNELLRQVKVLQNVDKGFQTKLGEIIVNLREISNGLKRISKEYSNQQTEMELWDNYKQFQKERLRLLNLSHEWKTVWIPSLSKEFHHLISPVQNAIDKLTNSIIIFEDILRAHIAFLEIRNSRENRKVMRKLSFIALVVSGIFSYITLWKDIARDTILALEFQGLSPSLNYFLLLLTLLPVVCVLISAWLHLTHEQGYRGIIPVIKDLIQKAIKRKNGKKE